MSTKTDNFINAIAPLAVNEYLTRDKWVLPSVCIAQAALETGWGITELMKKANAFFGIKATKTWKGRVYSTKTSECYDGVSYTQITALFRAYGNVAESVADYYDLITKSARYAGAVNNTNSTSAITAIKEGGYATSPTYIEKVTSIIRDYDLERFDARPVAVPPEQVPIPVRRSNEDIASDVIRGVFGNGEERKRRLAENGYDYNIIQAIVNQISSNSRPIPVEPVPTIQIGSRVFLNTGAKFSNGVQPASFVYTRPHEVKSINGDEVIITFGGVSVGIVRLSDLRLA